MVKRAVSRMFPLRGFTLNTLLCVLVTYLISSAVAELLETHEHDGQGERKDGEEKLIQSVGFALPSEGYTCPSVPCITTMNDLVLQSAYVHMVIGTDHPTSYALLIYRVCEALQKCIHPQNLHIILQHRQVEDVSISFRNCSNFLRHVVGASYLDWWGTFTADNKMKQTYRALAGLPSTLPSHVNTNNAPDTDATNIVNAEARQHRLIYQTDIDEVPDPTLFALALEEFQRGECDAIRGYWRDRITLDGSLAPIAISGQHSLEDQFPLRCEISNNVVGAGMTRKVIAYRANYRVRLFLLASLFCGTLFNSIMILLINNYGSF
jgi:hypothetical protein